MQTKQVPVESTGVDPGGGGGSLERILKPSDGQKALSFSSADAAETDIRTITSLYLKNLSITFFIQETNSASQINPDPSDNTYNIRCLRIKCDGNTKLSLPLSFELILT